MKEVQNRQVKSKKRIADHGEVFTSKREVNAMLDLVKHETERIESRFFEPACGDGNFLYEILNRKFQIVNARYSKNNDDFNKYIILSIASVYGVELLDDNTQQCRNRLFNFFIETYTESQKINPSQEIIKSVKFIFDRNILCGDALTLLKKDGSPIIFSEWSLVNRIYLKRRDFALSEMLKFPPLKNNDRKKTTFEEMDLLSDFAETNEVIRPLEIDFPLIEYWRVYEFIK